MMSLNLSDITILKIKNADYCCITSGISKSEATKLWQGIDLTLKNGTLEKNRYQKTSINYLSINLLGILFFFKKKVENCKLKKYKNLKVYIKMQKTVIKCKKQL